MADGLATSACRLCAPKVLVGKLEGCFGALDKIMLDFSSVLFRGTGILGVQQILSAKAGWGSPPRGSGVSTCFPVPGLCPQ